MRQVLTVAMYIRWEHDLGSIEAVRAYWSDGTTTLYRGRQRRGVLVDEFIDNNDYKRYKWDGAPRGSSIRIYGDWNILRDIPNNSRVK